MSVCLCLCLSVSVCVCVCLCMCSKRDICILHALNGSPLNSSFVVKILSLNNEANFVCRHGSFSQTWSHIGN